MTPQPRYQPGDRIGGRYQVHKALMGGMGEVYLCLDLESNYPRALKTFQQRYLTDAQRLRHAFEQEVATWVALEKHPNIVRCFYMDTLDRQPFMVLEWIAGEEGRGTDLRGWLRRGPLDLKLALQIAIDICYGLLHTQTKRPGLVHRDLKPENILMAQGGLAKITDFGLAELAQSAGLTLDLPASTGDGRHSLMGGQGIAGTPVYMAPEQWRGEALDERTDIYAVGVILYELLTGHPPFVVVLPSSTPQSVQTWLSTLKHAHEKGQVTSLPSVLPAALNDLVQRCLAKTPAARYPTLAELLMGLADLYQVHFDHAPPPRPTSAAFTVGDYSNRGVTYHALREHTAALTNYTHAIHLNPNVATVYVNRGLTYAALHEHTAALADYNQALTLNPNDAQAYSNRGGTYATLQEHAAALADYNQALLLDPNYAQAHYNRGVTYDALQEHAAALSDYTTAIQLNPNFAQAYINRGVTYADLQEHAAALANYTQAIHLDPTLAQAYYNQGNTYRALQDYTAALTDYTHAIELDPNFAQAYANRGVTFAALRDYAAALADYTHAIYLDPNLTQTYYNRGITYADLREYAPALADYTHAITLDPNFAQAYANRGVTYAALGEDAEALADYTYALHLDPNYAKAYLNIGDLLANQGRLQDALPYFEQATQLGYPQGAQYAARVRQRLGMEPEPPSDSAQAAFAAFQQADSVEAMQQAAVRFPLLLQPEFIAIIEQVIAQQVLLEHRLAFTQRLTWLRQIASTQRSTP